MVRAMGIDPATPKYVPLNIIHKKNATNYMNLLHHPLENQRIDFWWLDWQQESTTNIPEVTPTWWLSGMRPATVEHFNRTTFTSWDSILVAWSLTLTQMPTNAAAAQRSSMWISRA